MEVENEVRSRASGSRSAKVVVAGIRATMDSGEPSRRLLAFPSPSDPPARAWACLVLLAALGRAATWWALAGGCAFLFALVQKRSDFTEPNAPVAWTNLYDFGPVPSALRRSSVRVLQFNDDAASSSLSVRKSSALLGLVSFRVRMGHSLGRVA